MLYYSKMNTEQIYMPEFKRMVRNNQKKRMNARKAMRRFKINDHSILDHWERIYLEEWKLQSKCDRYDRSGFLQQPPWQTKVKGLDACTSQTTSPFGCLNDFLLQRLTFVVTSMRRGV